MESKLTPNPNTASNLIDAAARVLNGASTVEWHGLERRAQRRHLVGRTCVAQSLDEEWLEVDQPILVFVKDVSRDGLGILHTERIASEHIVVVLPLLRGTEEVRVIGRVVRHRELEEKLHEHGIELIARLQDTPAIMAAGSNRPFAAH